MILMMFDQWKEGYFVALMVSFLRLCVGCDLSLLVTDMASTSPQFCFWAVAFGYIRLLNQPPCSRHYLYGLIMAWWCDPIELSVIGWEGYICHWSTIMKVLCRFSCCRLPTHHSIVPKNPHGWTLFATSQAACNGRHTKYNFRSRKSD